MSAYNLASPALHRPARYRLAVHTPAVGLA